MDFRAGDDRYGIVEQVDQLAEHPGLGLASQTQKEHVVLGEDRVTDLGDHRLFIAQDIGKQGLARLELGDQVAPHFIFDGLDPIPARLELAQVPGRSFVITGVPLHLVRKFVRGHQECVRRGW